MFVFSKFKNISFEINLTNTCLLDFFLRDSTNRIEMLVCKQTSPDLSYHFPRLVSCITVL